MRGQAERPTSVLVVEDDYVSLEVITALFEHAGLKVHVASSGEAALTILRDRGAEIDWLFTDVRLPGLLDGGDVAEAYRLAHPYRPVIYASSARNRPPRAVQGSVFVEKPFAPAQILHLARMMAEELDAHTGLMGLDVGMGAAAHH
jgi:two-component system, OmpR family, response regulator